MPSFEPCQIGLTDISSFKNRIKNVVLLSYFSMFSKKVRKVNLLWRWDDLWRAWRFLARVYLYYMEGPHRYFEREIHPDLLRKKGVNWLLGRLPTLAPVPQGDMTHLHHIPTFPLLMMVYRMTMNWHIHFGFFAASQTTAQQVKTIYVHLSVSSQFRKIRCWFKVKTVYSKHH